MAGTDRIEDIVRALQGPGSSSSDFDLNPEVVLPPGRKLRNAGVLCAIEDGSRGPMVILTKRSARLKHHPGQIAFPGGKQDETDADSVAAALREAEEEIGLPRGHVDVLGTMSAHETVTGFMVTPVIGLVTDSYEDRPETGEVDEIFRVPLSHVTDVAMFRIEGRRWRGSIRHYYTVPYGPYYIWGATARILRTLAERVGG
jgi:8-oxo-dGTP pyrophosphatase MutT (NUDIX family)